jgi:DNA topoisomerase-3
MAESQSTTVAVLAEKPSVARDIARVLGATSKGDGYLHGNGYVVTWAIGHLASLAQPHEINPAWKQWRADRLPMLPREWPLVVYDKTKDQFEVVRKIVTSPKVAQVVCATDAGREGELIFRYIYEAAGCQKPVRRLWISSLTPEAIRKGFDGLRPGTDYDSLADAARGRSRADWLVGMNLSRAYSLAFNEDLSVGRVQTPTLAMLVERELAVRSFVPEDYQEVVATFHPQGLPDEQRYQGTWFRTKEDGADKEKLQKAMRLAADGKEAEQIVARARSGEAAIESIESATQRMSPLPLYDLTELQRHANRLYGFSAQSTLDLAQALYERHKLISYPRTDSRHLSKDVAGTLPQVVRAIEAPYREMLAPGTGERPLGKRFVDDAKVTDHHAIIPTATAPRAASLSPEEKKIYDLVCRRLLSAWHEDHIWSVTTVITAIRNGELVDRYHTSGTAVQQVGWKVLEIVTQKKKAAKGTAEDATDEQVLPPGLERGQRQDVLNAVAQRKKTRAPKRFTEGTLLTAMETAGKTLDEKELSDAMKETGLGTPATRASIIEVLLKRGYIERSGKSLTATDKGIRLIEVVHPEVKSPAMTGQWEAFLTRIHRGKEQLEPFLRGIEDYVREVVGKVGQTPRPPAAAAAPRTKAVNGTAEAAAAPPAPPLGPPPPPEAGELAALLYQTFGFSSFRPNQEAVCQAAIEGKDVLLVMPTGSGKSLCYQLPGIARGGTTLVISPLIALMEDQVAKLQQRGLAVDRIHSGQPRAASRQVCIDYLQGKLQFLFIAPERLRVAGFPEMLAKRKPALIAIDEAHCISQWGHDFRPDYRRIGQYLPLLRPAPVMALTATATPIVQEDIQRQLGLESTARFIHGFRRENLAVEVVEAAPSARAGLALELLMDDDRRPGIVYAPTRKQVTALAAQFGSQFPTAAYHAGLDAEHRSRVQEAFQAGRIEVMVATIAFGMGIDKADVRTVIHTALPGSLEAYYQEIGRAGRDGKPSRAVLMHSYADRYTHDFFFERDYPDVRVLDAMFARLASGESVEKAALQRQVKMEGEQFDKALEKLWVHGGAVVDYAENITRGETGWRESYLAHGEQKKAQIDLMIRYAETNQCRMATVVRHFGDTADGRAACGICDFCAPADCVAQQFREPTAEESEAAHRVLERLRQGDQKATGRLHSDLYGTSGTLTRDAFEEVLGAMARAGLVKLADAVFEKDGRQIPYRTVRATSAGREVEPEERLELVMKEAVAAARGGKKKRGATARKRVGRKVAAKAAAPSAVVVVANGSAQVRADALRAWRLAEARRQGVPAFRIFTDKTLQAIADARPRQGAELAEVPGMSAKGVEKYGRQIFRILEQVEPG